MKLTTKRSLIASLSAVFALSLASGASVLLVNNEKTAVAEDGNVPSSVYYYDNLTDAEGNEYTLAKKFYNALDDMNKKGDFKDGVVDYSLTGNNLATSDMIKAWVTGGDLTIPKAFSAARDAYYMDHPELFYIDIYKMTISAASDGTTYTAYIDSGREANLYADGEFTSEEEVETALTAYYAKIDVIAEYAKTEADKEQYGTAKKVLQARYANQYIATQTEYDDIAASDSAITTASRSQTAYGALVEGKSVCNGYSRAFKAVMDKLEIPCVVVGGYSIAKSSEGNSVDIGEAHAWNYVWFEPPISEEDEGVATQSYEGGAWYGYDVTWNSTGNSVYDYVNMGNFAMMKDHSPDGEISTSGYLVKYPQLSNYNYGCKTNSNGIVYSINYFDVLDDDGNVELDDDGNTLVNNWETVSFNGKGAVRLFEEDGLRLIYRRANMGENGEPNWTSWTDLYLEATEGPFSEKMAYGDSVAYKDLGNEITFFGNTHILYSQYAVVSGIDPDLPLYPNLLDDRYIAGYSDKINLEDYVVALSDMAVNDAYLTYVPAPYIVKATPDQRWAHYIEQSWAIPGTNQMADEYAFEVEIEYNEPLEALDPTQPIGVSFTSAFEYGTRANIYDYAHFVPLYEDENGEKTWIEIVGENKNILRFKFAPSLMYEHNGMHYYFTFSNVGSAYVNYRADGSEYVSHKAPNVYLACFIRSYIACTKCLPNGRMLVDCVAQPTLISNTDLSEVNFQDENGNYYSAGQRSQMMLVVNKPTEAENETMNELLDQNTDINVKTDEIKAAETYEIDLQICGRYTYIPNDSYVKIALGFPEGYGPDDEGITFKIYHYKRSADRKQIIAVEEIPCVVTKFGIVATVNSFSPFMIVAVDADKATTKNVYASVDGKGGKLNNADGQIQTLNEGDSYTYTIVPDDGYMVYTVTLNNKIVTDKVVDGKLTVTYDELAADNELEIKYISNEAAVRYVEKGIVEPVKVVLGTDGSASVIEGTGGKVELDVSGLSEPDNSNKTLIIIICVAVAIVVVLGIAITVVMIKHRRVSADDED